MWLRELARVSAALARCALIRSRDQSLPDLAKLLPDEIHHQTRARREMSSRWVDQAEGNAGCGKVAQDPDQCAVAEIIEDFEQGETGDTVPGTRRQMHGALYRSIELKISTQTGYHLFRALALAPLFKRGPARATR